MDLTKHELAYLKEGITKENLLSYPVLNGYNFQGARMDSARFFFAHIQNSDLRGVKMGSLQYGYTSVRGRIDKFTQMPQEGSCKYVNDSLKCVR
jgi:uncharacterized protein YjbI with pentapeptide repeats